MLPQNLSQMWPLVVPQSLGQLVAVSPVSQVPLPHLAVAGQSAGQLAVVSPASHLALPHLAAVLHPDDCAQVAMSWYSETAVLPAVVAHAWTQMLSLGTHLARHAKRPWHLTSATHTANWLGHAAKMHWLPGSQSLGQLLTVSVPSHFMSPHTGVGVPQSLLQVVLVSPVSHLPLPHTGLVSGGGAPHAAKMLLQAAIAHVWHAAAPGVAPHGDMHWATAHAAKLPTHWLQFALRIPLLLRQLAMQLVIWSPVLPKHPPLSTQVWTTV